MNFDKNAEKQMTEMLTYAGVSNAQAAKAVAACKKDVKRGAAAGFAVGTGYGLLTSNPAALIMGLFAAAGGAGLTYLSADQCKKLRKAATDIY